MRRPVSTYSIVANDGDAMGVAVHSHWFSVGSVVPWVKAGVGAVAIQSIPDLAHGPRALELLQTGSTPSDVVDSLLADDPEREYRQSAVVAADGMVAAHTGSLCIAEAGHRLGDGYSAQANLMDRSTVWDAMGDAFEAAEGDLAERMLAALEAADTEGGDIRGRQSAAIAVVEAGAETGPDRPFADLRVEDDPDPLSEMRRLVELRRGYLLLSDGDDLVSKGDLEAALGAYSSALEIIPDEAINGEAAFWVGVTLAGEGRVEEAIDYLRRAQAQHDRWTDVIPRLPGSQLLPDDAELIDLLVSQMRG